MPGAWVGNEWRVADFAGTGVDMPQIANRPASTWPQTLDGKSVLLVGSSLDRNAVKYLCEQHLSVISPYLAYGGLVGAATYDYCRIGNVTVGQFMNYGVFEPPYWKYAYKGLSRAKGMPDTLQNTSTAHILIDASKFRSVTSGRDPTLVVFSSYLWDLASEWEHTGSMAHGYKISDDFVARWVARLQHYMHTLRRAFPTSRLAWRTAPTVPSNNPRSTPEIILSMNEAARTFAIQHDILVVDYFSICAAPGSPESEHLKKDVHPGKVGSMAYMNVLLNVLAETNDETTAGVGAST